MATSAAKRWSLGAAGAAALAIAAGVAAVVGLWMRDRATQKELATTRAEADAALNAVITPDMLAALDKSVYKVTTTGGSGGTAFVVDREQGVLATAAHVAELFDPAKPNLVVINRKTGRPLPVITVKLHEGYRELDRHVHDYGPLDPSARIAAPRIEPILANPLDVALIIVDPLDKKTGENLLGPDMKVASDETVKALKSGDVVAVLGFPGDSVTATLGPQSASSRVERGVLGAMISPIDHFAFSNDAATTYLLASRIDLIPGNSGGPLVNRAGEVIGITTFRSDRDGIAQRADLLRDLLEPLREERRLAELYRPDWKRRLEQWKKAEDQLPVVQYLRLRRGAAKDPQDPAPERIADIDFSIERPVVSTSQPLALGSMTQRYVYRARDLETSGGNVAAASPAPASSGDGVASSTVRGFVFEGAGDAQYAVAATLLQPDKTHALYVWDAGLMNGEGQCRLELFVRRQGETAFRGPATGSIPVAVFRETDDTSVQPIIEALVRRRACPSSADDIKFGVASWVDGKPSPRGAPVLQLAANKTAPNDSAAAGAPTRLVGAVSTRLVCLDPKRARDDMCGKLVHATAINASAIPAAEPTP
ncbi:MAG: trypsin-like peptidase domain-containing protein [Parvularculaceae bacterium]|nr:trypsin-like peptidase domain-containing protein [Parvularculaceae bacterium]